MARIKTGLVIDIGRHTIPVVVSNEGLFWAEWEGDSYRSTTYKGLRVALLPKVREDAKRCSVPALVRDYNGRWSPITLIGIHADNGNVLYLDEEGKTCQLSRRDRRILRPLTPAERRAHSQLVAKIKRAERTLNDWLKQRSLEPGKAVRQAIGLPAEPRRDDPIDDDEDDDDLL